jgi:hypothetical protein
MNLADEPLHAIELNFAASDESVEDKIGDTAVLWKDILPEGKFPLMPGVGGRKIPFEVVPTGTSSLADKRISMADLIASYDQKAFPSGVTIPDGHPEVDDHGNLKDTALNNTGYVNGLRVVKKGDKHVLQAALGFTEPDVAARVRRGSVPNVSSGVLFNWVRKSDAKRFPCAINHVALTKIPWIDGLEPFKRVFASDDIAAATVAQFEDGEDNSNDKAEVVWNDQDGTNWLRTAIAGALNPDPEPGLEGMPIQPRPFYDVRDIAAVKKLALATEFYKGNQKEFVIPYDIKDDKVDVAPASRWIEGQQALVAASDGMTADEIGHQLQADLDEMVDSAHFEVTSVSFDNRCDIRNQETGQGFSAPFSVVGNTVFLHDASLWERTDTVPPTVEPQQQQRPDYSPSNVTPMYNKDTPEGRVAAARQRRRTQFAG